jgi:superfamily II DNA or RNA helicase
LALLRPRTALLIGRETDEIAAQIASSGTQDSRVSRSARRLHRLHNGIYAFMRGGEWHTVWVAGGKEAVQGEDGRLTFNTNHLGEAVYTHEDEWDDAQPLLGESPVHAGELIGIVGRSGWGRVVRVRRLAEGHTADVDVNGIIENFDVVDLTRLDGDLRDPDFWIAQGPADAINIARTLSWVKLAYPLSDTLYSYAATKTTFKPYQFIPVLKMLNSESGRLLIADEVGLGKTIEAGLIWTELEQRNPINRAIVVVPAALKVKWRQEMDRRFMRPLPELSVADLSTFLNDVRDGKDADLIGLISLERLRSAKDVLAQFTELSPQLDLVIVDEAHSMRNSRTSSHDVGAVLGNLADHVVFLSATPLNLGTHDLYTLVNLLEPGVFADPAVFSSQLEPNKHLNAVMRIMADPMDRSKSAALRELNAVKQTEHGLALAGRPTFEKLEELLIDDAKPSIDDIARVKRFASDLNTLGSVVTRTRKIDVPGKKALREVEEVTVKWSESERDLYTAIEEHLFRRARAANAPLGFAQQMPLRQACSSLVVAQQRLAERDGWNLHDSDEEAAEQAARTDLGDESPFDTEIEIDPELTELLLRTRLDHDSKLEALIMRLRLARQNGMQQALIFSYFRGTVDYLASELATECRTGVLHGGVPVGERQQLIDSFRAGEIDVLVANQVGSEGLDFEFCNVLVNYDLPWNPMQVEQRIGRLDRFGQKSDKIHIFNMFTPDTIESKIFGRLYARIGVFENSIGDLEPIMRGGFSELNKTILNPHLSEDQKIRAIDQFDVAVSQERDRAKHLEEQSGMLNSLALLDVEGLSEAGPTNGRYVGAAELHALLATALRAKDATLEATSDQSIWTVHGSLALSASLSAYRQRKVGTMHGVAKLLGMIRDGTPITITFDPQHALVSKIELVTARHPLIKFAVDLLTEKKEQLARFGRVGLAALLDGEAYVATIDLVRTTGGLKDKHELWVTAVNLNSGEPAEDLPDVLMTALAEGTLTISSFEAPAADVMRRRSELVRSVSIRRALERIERRQENDALIASRVTSEAKSLSIQLQRAQNRLQTAQANGTAAQIERMVTAQMRNLNARIYETSHRYDLKRNIAMSLENVAVLLISTTGE